MLRGFLGEPRASMAAMAAVSAPVSLPVSTWRGLMCEWKPLLPGRLGNINFSFPASQLGGGESGRRGSHSGNGVTISSRVAVIPGGRIAWQVAGWRAAWPGDGHPPSRLFAALDVFRRCRPSRTSALDSAAASVISV